MDLITFNELVLQTQDLAYTLAWRFLADDGLAEQVVEKAILDLAGFARGCDGASFREALLHRVAARLLKISVQPERPERPRAIPPNAEEEVARRLCALQPLCRLVVILVDCLGLSYREAAAAGGTSFERVRSSLAEGRVKLAPDS
jgi:DNA-directed RNA polymerase specialized sigma24 family protein